MKRNYGVIIGQKKVRSEDFAEAPKESKSEIKTKRRRTFSKKSNSIGFIKNFFQKFSLCG